MSAFGGKADIGVVRSTVNSMANPVALTTQDEPIMNLSADPAPK